MDLQKYDLQKRNFNLHFRIIMFNFVIECLIGILL